MVYDVVLWAELWFVVCGCVLVQVGALNKVSPKIMRLRESFVTFVTLLARQVKLPS
jgi:hypothetical protein